MAKQPHFDATQLFSATTITGSVVVCYYITPIVGYNTEIQANDYEYRIGHVPTQAPVFIYASTL